MKPAIDSLAATCLRVAEQQVRIAAVDPREAYETGIAWTRVLNLNLALSSDNREIYKEGLALMFKTMLEEGLDAIDKKAELMQKAGLQ